MRIRTPGALLLTLAALCCVFASRPSTARADSITVIPPKFEVYGNPGDVISDSIKVTSDAPTQVTYQVEVQDFTPQGDQGGVNILDDPQAPITNISLARWITAEPSRFTLDSGQEKVVNFTIKIPKSGEPGGKYATILIRRAGDKISGGAIVDTQVGSLLLLRVSGNVTEKLNLVSLTTDDTYYQHGPVSFTLRTTNTGNVHVAPTGTFVITNMFGHKVAEIPLTRANVLPTSTRAVKTVWDNQKIIGRFTANLVANYGQQNQQIVASTSFTIIPLSLIWAVVILLVVLFLMVTQRRHIRRLINRITSD